MKSRHPNRKFYSLKSEDIFDVLNYLLFLPPAFLLGFRCPLPALGFLAEKLVGLPPFFLGLPPLGGLLVLFSSDRL